jgi:arsenite/tail-anchored protein-transporting ATPase
MSLESLYEKKELKFILFGGKGGVGKTTMAASSAIHLAERLTTKKILVFTTDPAPSLADSLEQKLSNDPSKVKDIDNLWAMEINAEEELKKFKKKYGDDILDILQQGTYLSDEETEEMFSLDVPGLDEIMGLKKITDFMDATEDDMQKNADSSAEKRVNGQGSNVNGQMFDMYILDTAPTGHTLRLLTLPELLDNWIKFLSSLRWKYHYMIDRLSRGQADTKAKADEFLLEMKRTVKKVQTLLRDSEKTTFITVTIPESMGVLETKDLIRDLKKSNIPTQNIIINNIVPEDSSAFLKERRKAQNRYIDDIKKTFSEFNITEILLEADEIKGKTKLASLGKKLFNTR